MTHPHFADGKTEAQRDCITFPNEGWGSVPDLSTNDWSVRSCSVTVLASIASHHNLDSDF